VRPTLRRPEKRTAGGVRPTLRSREAAYRAANREARRTYMAAYRASQKEAARLHAWEATFVQYEWTSGQGREEDWDGLA
jgi:hypothetical protein